MTVVASVSPLWGIAGALIALAGIVLGQVVVGVRGSRDRRRNEYSAAFASALAWCELPYKVARRLSNNREDVAPIIETFHKAQTDLFFHRMWLRSVSSETASAYERLVSAIQAQTHAHITAAWERAPWDPASGPLGPLYHVDVGAQQSAFSEAVERDLSLWKRLTSPRPAAFGEDGYKGRFRRLYGGKSFTAYLAGCLAAAGVLAEHHLWPVFVVVVAAAVAPTGLAVKEMPSQRRSRWLIASALILACLFTLVVVFGIAAAFLGFGVLAVGIFAGDVLVNREQHQKCRQTNPGVPASDEQDG